ncbi:MADS-box transcription factor PHERES 2-like [Cucurbita pepo subsp. pepo]|uniref:MADS-box transcription factor PHERES 2-like n=1 Tax=Cucurbita pepo subsp. pepo TaxID=3664 RepID=UPI000C9D3AD1|nr:MADS-box transcription factor PHERES 2-like [Cucurbita pepo subsp. pepo]
MGRGKLSMKLISNEKSRKTTFSKRKNSLMRKAYELSTLCDVRTCVIVHGPNQSDQSPIHTWPSSRDSVNDMIASYKSNCLHKRTRKSFNLFDFFSDRKKKIESDMSKLRKDVAKARYPKWDERLECLMEEQLRVLMVEIDSKLDATKRRIENVEERVSGGSNQTLNANMNKNQLISFEETQPMMAYNQIQAMPQDLQAGSSAVPMIQMDHEFENLNQFIYGSSLPQIHGNYFQNPNFCSDPTNGMIMDSTQSYSMCHYGVPLAPTHSIMPLSYMQLTDDQMMMGCSSNSQMGLPNASNQVNDQLDYFNYEYFMKNF